MKTLLSLPLIGLCLWAWLPESFALGHAIYVETLKTGNSFAIVQDNLATPIWVDGNDFPGVLRAVNDLQKDLFRVTGRTPAISRATNAPGTNLIIIGTIGKNSVIDQLIRDRKIDVTTIAGQWETFLIQEVSKPLPGVSSALVIAGSDKRGAIYGIYDLSEQIGVSPWCWWSDVPVEHKANPLRQSRQVRGRSAVCQISRPLS
jgi:alpha-glucuronidase